MSFTPTSLDLMVKVLCTPVTITKYSLTASARTLTTTGLIVITMITSDTITYLVPTVTVVTSDEGELFVKTYSSSVALIPRTVLNTSFVSGTVTVTSTYSVLQSVLSDVVAVKYANTPVPFNINTIPTPLNVLVTPAGLTVQGVLEYLVSTTTATSTITKLVGDTGTPIPAPALLAALAGALARGKRARSSL
jgi:hypothetical protein